LIGIYISEELHGFASQKTIVVMLAVVQTSYIISLTLNPTADIALKTAFNDLVGCLMYVYVAVVDTRKCKADQSNISSKMYLVSCV
jgi:hypothetical protein